MPTLPGFTDNLDGGSLDVSVSPSNSVFDAVTGGGTALFTNDDPFQGTLAVRITVAGANRSLEANLGVEDQAWVGFAVRVEAAPSGVTAICNTFNTGVLVGNLRLNTNRTLNFRDSATSRWTSSTVLALDTWYEVRVLTNPAGNNARVKVYDDTGALLEDSGVLTLNVSPANTLDEVRIGFLTGSVSATMVIDRLVADDTDEPAPQDSGTPGYLYYDNGTAWVDVTGDLYYDNGTSWVSVG